MNTTIMLGGSLGFEVLPKEFTEEIDKYIGSSVNFIVGDAHGADTLIQSYLVRHGQLRNVVVYYTGLQPRFKIGDFNSRKISTTARGRDFYAAKDIAMCTACDIGIFLWDGKSKGTEANINRLINTNKLYVVFTQKGE